MTTYGPQPVPRALVRSRLCSGVWRIKPLYWAVPTRYVHLRVFGWRTNSNNNVQLRPVTWASGNPRKARNVRFAYSLSFHRGSRSISIHVGVSASAISTGLHPQLREGPYSRHFRGGYVLSVLHLRSSPFNDIYPRSNRHLYLSQNPMRCHRRSIRNSH